MRGNNRLYLDPSAGRRPRRAARIRHRRRHDSITALWGDSWHQHPEVKIFEGTIDERGLISAGYEYADGWRWEIILDPTDTDVLSLRMDNVILPEAATAEIPAVAYAAMLMELRRTFLGDCSSLASDNVR